MLEIQKVDVQVAALDSFSEANLHLGGGRGARGGLRAGLPAVQASGNALLLEAPLLEAPLLEAPPLAEPEAEALAELDAGGNFFCEKFLFSIFLFSLTRMDTQVGRISSARNFCFQNFFVLFDADGHAGWKNFFCEDFCFQNFQRNWEKLSQEFHVETIDFKSMYRGADRTGADPLQYY
jgi:hypothetical protein